MNHLISAVQNVDPVLVASLLENGADATIDDNQPILSACQGGGEGTRNIIRMLVEYGGNVHARGDLPLLLAIQNRDLAKIKLIVELGNNNHLYPRDMAYMLEKRYKIIIPWE